MKTIKTMLSLGTVLLLSSTSVMAMPIANVRAVCLHSYSSWSKTKTYWSSVGTSSVCRDCSYSRINKPTWDRVHPYNLEEK